MYLVLMLTIFWFHKRYISSLYKVSVVRLCILLLMLIQYRSEYLRIIWKSWRYVFWQLVRVNDIWTIVSIGFSSKELLVWNEINLLYSLCQMHTLIVVIVFKYINSSETGNTIVCDRSSDSYTYTLCM